MSRDIRLATESDAASIAAIYAPYVESDVISFEYEAPTPMEIAARIKAITVQWPWLVLTDEGEIAGYAYAGRHHDRAAYGWSVNVSVYVSPRFHRRGVGRSLYSALFAVLKWQGYYKAYAGITMPNPASVAIHESFGFKRIGIYHGVGYKNGAWRDVAWYEGEVQPERPEPLPPRPVSAAVGSPIWDQLLSSALQ